MERLDYGKNKVGNDMDSDWEVMRINQMLESRCQDGRSRG